VGNYTKGRRLEHRARQLLEDAGFEVIRSAGSKGPVDLIGFDAISIRLISVKSAGRYVSAVEREALQLLPRPSNASVEIWRFAFRSRHPLIERL
jgi:Holliday junction resolvase